MLDTLLFDRQYSGGEEHPFLPLGLQGEGAFPWQEDHGHIFERRGHPDMVIGYGFPNSWEFSLSCSSLLLAKVSKGYAALRRANT
jgi:hypothetical protein